MYEITINQRPLRLVSTEVAQTMLPAEEGHLIARYAGKTRYLLHYIDMLEKGSPRVNEVTLYAADVEELWADYQQHYRLIHAAGGLVRNEVDDILFIHRLGYWDLPKGKLDDGEKHDVAALREVKEETGIVNVRIEDFLTITYHTYRDRKDQRVLKHTYWFTMHTTDTVLTPQTTEDITEAVWMSKDDFFEEERKTYLSILDVLGLIG